MALSASPSTLEARIPPMGPYKEQLINLEAQSGDTTGLVTISGLSSVSQVIVTGLILTAPPSYDGNNVTLSFVDPGRTIHGQLIAQGY
jgi:hypothetical protein